MLFPIQRGPYKSSENQRGVGKSWGLQNNAWGLAVSLVYDMAPKEALFLLSLNVLIHSEKKIKLQDSPKDIYSSSFLWSLDVPRLGKGI